MFDIAGFATSTLRAEPAGVISGMARVIAYREPDDKGSFQATSRSRTYMVGLGHWRLSVVDLSTGLRPRCNDAGRMSVNSHERPFRPLKKLRALYCSRIFTREASSFLNRRLLGYLWERPGGPLLPVLAARHLIHQRGND